jgi:hypothetical protein
MIRAIHPDVVIPVHTEHPELFETFGPRVLQPTYRGTLEL